MENYVRVIAEDEVNTGKIGYVLERVGDDACYVTFDLETPFEEQSSKTWLSPKSPVWPFNDFELESVDESDVL